MLDLQGPCTAIITPFDQQDRIDFTVIPPFLEFQRSHGIQGVVVAGTNGEGTSLSVTERKQLLESVLEHRGDLTVIAGTGAASVVDAIDLTRHASENGVDAVLVLPPFFFKSPTAQGVAAYFRKVMDASTVPVLLYSIPQFSAVAITDEVLERLEDHPRFAGVKDSAGIPERTETLINRYRGRTVCPGSDYVLAKALVAGATTNISGTANSLPELIAVIHRAVQAGRDGTEEQARLTGALSVIQKYPLLAANKSILAHRGLPRMWVRSPLVDLTAEQEGALISELQDIGLP